MTRRARGILPWWKIAEDRMDPGMLRDGNLRVEGLVWEASWTYVPSRRRHDHGL